MKSHHPRSFGGRFTPLPTEQIPPPLDTEVELPIPKGEGVAEMQGKSAREYTVFVRAINGPEVAKQYETVCAIARDVAERGGRALLVGGCVRDEILGMPSKDFDLEVYRLPAEEIHEIVAVHGPIKEVGKAYGVLKLGEEKSDDDAAKTEPIDISLPRYDSKTGDGKRGFGGADPHMSIKEAAKRRDFTLNAVLKDPLTGIIYDPYGGVHDLRERTLRITDPDLFKDDPARVLRAAQFVGRFGLRIDPESMQVLRETAPHVKDMAPERIGEEWEKLLAKSLKPSMGLHALREMGVIDDAYPELAALVGLQLDYTSNPEGDAWTHTLLAVDAARDMVRHERMEGDDVIVVMFATLCHDVGRPNVRDKDAGARAAEQFLNRMRINKKTIDAVSACVREHVRPAAIYRQHIAARERGEKDLSDGALRMLARDIHPATIEQLVAVAEADARGRGPFFDQDHQDQMLLPDPFLAGAWVRTRARELGILREKPQPILQGRDLMALGHQPYGQTAKWFGIMLNLAQRAHDEVGWSREDIIAHIQTHSTLEQAANDLKHQFGW